MAAAVNPRDFQAPTNPAWLARSCSDRKLWSRYSRGSTGHHDHSHQLSHGENGYRRHLALYSVVPDARSKMCNPHAAGPRHFRHPAPGYQQTMRSPVPLHPADSHQNPETPLGLAQQCAYCAIATTVQKNCQQTRPTVHLATYALSAVPTFQEF